MIISDRDLKFTGDFWREVTKMLRIRCNMTAAYHPSADGQAEKMN